LPGRGDSPFRGSKRKEKQAVIIQEDEYLVPLESDRERRSERN